MALWVQETDYGAIGTMKERELLYILNGKIGWGWE